MARGATKEELARAEIGDYLTLDDAFCGKRRAMRLLSESVCKRNNSLAGEVKRLFSEGVDSADVLVICASSVAVGRMRQLVVDKCSRESELARKARAVEIVSAREKALEILGTPDGMGVCGRTFPKTGPRLLSAFETDFLLEDLKTFGTRAKRLREVLKFIYRGWTELADESDCWLVTVEEKDIVSFLHDELRYLQGILEPEASNFASKAIRQCEGARKRFSRRHVLVQDYQNLSRASQLLCNALALDSITVTADAHNTVEVYESYPYRLGVEEFLDVNERAQTCDLDVPVNEGKAAASSAMVDVPAGEIVGGSPVSAAVSWDSPDEEIRGIARMIARRIEEGVRPQSIGAVCFHPYWRNHLHAELSKLGVSSTAFGRPLILKGDIRDLERSLALRMVSALRLLADSDDSMSWRCWIGYGDYLGKSLSFVPARKQTQQVDPDALFAQTARAGEEGARFERLVRNCQGLRGRSLLELLSRQLTVGGETGAETAFAGVPSSLRPLLALGDEATPCEMLSELVRLQFFPELPPNGNVAVGSPEAIMSLGFEEVYLVGFVNGLFPQRSYFDLTQVSINQQAKIGRIDAQCAAALAHAASERITLSFFSRAEQEFAERCKLKQERIFIESDGTRMSEIAPSIYATREMFAGLE